MHIGSDVVSCVGKYQALREITSGGLVMDAWFRKMGKKASAPSQIWKPSFKQVVLDPVTVTLSSTEELRIHPSRVGDTAQSFGKVNETKGNEPQLYVRPAIHPLLLRHVQLLSGNHKVF